MNKWIIYAIIFIAAFIIGYFVSRNDFSKLNKSEIIDRIMTLDTLTGKDKIVYSKSRYEELSKKTLIRHLAYYS